MRTRTTFGPTVLLAALAALPTPAFAQTAAVPPPDIGQAVKSPAPSAAPLASVKLDVDATDAAVSAGAQYAAGNSKMVAGTGLGKLSLRRGADAFAASLVGNYARAYTVPALPPGTPLGTAPPPGAWQTSTENLQGKLRYDRISQVPSAASCK